MVRCLRGKNGISLIEVVIILAVAAILAGALTPALLTSFRKAKLRQAQTETCIIKDAITPVMERLSQAHYQWALEHLDAGRFGKAMWDLDLAINNNPKMLAAIKLKEKLLDKRKWGDEGSSIRTFISEEVMKEQGVIKPVFGRPGPPFEYPAIKGPYGFDDGAFDESQTDEYDDVNAILSTPSGEGES